MNPKDYAITTCDDPIRCPKPWTPVDSGYVMHEIGMVQNCRQPDNGRTQGPLRQLYWRAEWVAWPEQARLSRSFGPPPIAGLGAKGMPCPRICPELAAAGRHSYPCVRAGGKVLACISQSVVETGLKLKKYFANRVGSLAKWQTTLARWRLCPTSFFSVPLCLCGEVAHGWRRLVRCHSFPDLDTIYTGD